MAANPLLGIFQAEDLSLKKEDIPFETSSLVTDFEKNYFFGIICAILAFAAAKLNGLKKGFSLL